MKNYLFSLLSILALTEFTTPVNAQSPHLSILNPYKIIYQQDATSPPRLTVDTYNGRVGINTSAPTQTLDVNGKVLIRNARESVTIATEHPYNLWVTGGIVGEDLFIVNRNNWADYVFEENYPLMDLPALKSFIAEHKHLPNVPTQTTVQKEGYSQHDINVQLLQKVEELVLYTIEQEKKLEQQAELIRKQTATIEKLEKLFIDSSPSAKKE